MEATAIKEPAGIRLNCQSCNTEKSMIATKVSKFGGIVKLIGWLIAIPSALGVVICIISAFMVAGQPGDSQADQVGKGGAEVVFFFLGGVSLVGGLIGWILISKKKVFKCTVCGSIKDRD